MHRCDSQSIFYYRPTTHLLMTDVLISIVHGLEVDAI